MKIVINYQLQSIFIMFPVLVYYSDYLISFRFNFI